MRSATLTLGRQALVLAVVAGTTNCGRADSAPSLPSAPAVNPTATRRPIDIVKAFGSDNDDTHFLNYFAPARKILVAWPEEALPISVGIDTTGNSPRWSSAADSAWFWSAMTDFNEAMGRPVFQPTTSVALSTRSVVGVRIDYDNPGYLGSLGANLDVCRLPARACTDLHGVVIFARGIFYHSTAFDEQNFRSMQQAWNLDEALAGAR